MKFLPSQPLHPTVATASAGHSVGWGDLPSRQPRGLSSGGLACVELLYSSIVFTSGYNSLTWCFCPVVLEKTLENPLDCKEIKPVNPKGNLSWIFIGRTDAEDEAPILWPPDVKNWLIRKLTTWCLEGLKAGREGVMENEIVGWHHQLYGHEFK